MQTGVFNDPAQLPAFEQIRAAAYGELGDVLDTLRSDWRPGAGPSDWQADNLRSARKHITEAKAALNRAAT